MMQPEPAQLALGVQLRDHATFASFHAAGNEPAVAHLRALAAGRVEPMVFVWGEPASGKTHLLQAACSAGGAEGRRCGYLSLRESAVGAALAGWETLALVCVDDADCIVGDLAAERALMRLADGMRECEGSLVCAARENPLGLAWRLADLGSRLRAGPVYRLITLDEEQSLQALRLRASTRGLELPEETGRFLLRRWRRDMHSLYRLLDELDRASLAAQRRLTIPFVREVLAAQHPDATRVPGD